MAARKLRWGILSTANIGRKVIPSIRASHNGEVIAVASRTLDKAQAFASEQGIPTAYGSYEELINARDIDAIYIPLPNGEHAAWSIACADAGKHVLCEKPFTSNAEEAQRVVDVFEARRLHIAEAFMYRFHPQTRRVLELIHEGAVGEIQIINASFTFRLSSENNVRLDPALAGGSLMDVGCYPVSLMRMIAGEPSHVSGMAQFGSSGVDETFTGILQFPSGILGHFDCGMRSHRVYHYEIRGSAGRIVVHYGFPIPSDQPTQIWSWRDADGDTMHTETISPVNHYTLMAEDFASAVLDDRPPLFTAADAVAQMRVIDQLLASARDRLNGS